LSNETASSDTVLIGANVAASDHATELDGGTEDPSGTHASGHCDLCGHASGAAVGTAASLMAFPLIPSTQVVFHRDSLHCDPPLQRLDKPPR